MGNIDTLKIGYDISATYEVDAAFGELDIQDISFHDSLDTRLAQIDHGLYLNCDFLIFTYGDLRAIAEIVTYNFECSIAKSINLSFCYI